MRRRPGKKKPRKRRRRARVQPSVFAGVPWPVSCLLLRTVAGVSSAWHAKRPACVVAPDDQVARTTDPARPSRLVPTAGVKCEHGGSRAGTFHAAAPVRVRRRTKSNAGVRTCVAFAFACACAWLQRRSWSWSPSPSAAVVAWGRGVADCSPVVAPCLCAGRAGPVVRGGGGRRGRRRRRRGGSWCCSAGGRGAASQGAACRARVGRGGVVVAGLRGGACVAAGWARACFGEGAWRVGRAGVCVAASRAWLLRDVAACGALALTARAGRALSRACCSARGVRATAVPRGGRGGTRQRARARAWERCACVMLACAHVHARQHVRAGVAAGSRTPPWRRSAATLAEESILVTVGGRVTASTGWVLLRVRSSVRCAGARPGLRHGGSFAATRVEPLAPGSGVEGPGGFCSRLSAGVVQSFWRVQGARRRPRRPCSSRARRRRSRGRAGLDSKRAVRRLGDAASESLPGTHTPQPRAPPTQGPGHVERRVPCVSSKAGMPCVPGPPTRTRRNTSRTLVTSLRRDGGEPTDARGSRSLATAPHAHALDLADLQSNAVIKIE